MCKMVVGKHKKDVVSGIRVFAVLALPHPVCAEHQPLVRSSNHTWLVDMLLYGKREDAGRYILGELLVQHLLLRRGYGTGTSIPLFQSRSFRTSELVCSESPQNTVGSAPKNISGFHPEKEPVGKKNVCTRDRIERVDGRDVHRCTAVTHALHQLNTPPECSK